MRTVDDETQLRLQSAREGLLRMAGIVQRTAPSPDRRGGVPAEPAGALVGEAIRVNQPLADRQSVEIDLDVASPVAEIPVDAGLFQIACNLIRNALDAMPEGGRLSVDVASELGSIVLRVTDTGWGVPSDNLDDIFLPFYSTKAPGKGTGLGLAVCRDIAEGLGGEIRASRPAEGGMRFTVTVPVSADTEMLAEGATL
jgi:two-component system NtrC family sensor kinase